MCSLCWLPVAKNHNFGQIVTFLGLLYRHAFPDQGQIWFAIADSRYTFTCEFLSRSVYSVVLWRRKTPIFDVFWTSAFSDVASWHQSQKVEHRCTTANLPLSNGIKIWEDVRRGKDGTCVAEVFPEVDGSVYSVDVLMLVL